MKLRSYQSEACRKIVGEFEKGIQKTLLILPTGCGKTVVFNGVAFKYAYKKDRTPNGGRVLVLAHQNILINQAADKFSSVMKIPVSREKGKEHCQGSYPIAVSSMQTMVNRLDRFDPDYFDLIIIDEAHHTEAKGYTKILEYFKSAKVLGVTATPDRADGKRLTAFDSIAYMYTIDQAQKDGYLAPMHVVKSALQIDLSGVRKRSGDLINSDLGDAIEPYLHQIAEEIRRLAKGRRIVCFVPLIRTAQKACGIFSHYGFRSEWVSGNDPEKDLKLKNFEDGATDIIFNAMLLTEGWDCPETDCVVVLRPTMSRALYTQMVGRGLRLAEGKDDCLVIDFLFQSDGFDLASPVDVLGINLPKEPTKGMREPGEGQGGPGDAEERLIKKLEEAAASLIDPHKNSKWKSVMADADRRQDLIDPEWELADPDCTKNQALKLKALGIDPATVSYSEAQAILKYEDQHKPPTNAQKFRLSKLGFRSEIIESMSFMDARKELGRAKAMGRW